MRTMAKRIDPRNWDIIHLTKSTTASGGIEPNWLKEAEPFVGLPFKSLNSCRYCHNLTNNDDRGCCVACGAPRGLNG